MPAFTVQVPPITNRSVSALPGPIVSFACSPQQVLPSGHTGGGNPWRASALQESADIDFTNGAAIRNAAASIVSNALFHFCAEKPDSCSKPIYTPPKNAVMRIHASHSTGGV